MVCPHGGEKAAAKTIGEKTGRTTFFYLIRALMADRSYGGAANDSSQKEFRFGLNKAWLGAGARLLAAITSRWLASTRPTIRVQPNRSSG
jgi:hypothetical protein